MKTSNLLRVAALALALAVPTALGQGWKAPGPDSPSMHGQRAKFTCKRCHDNSDPLAVSAEKALAALNATCVGCHGTAKELAKELAGRLRNKHVNPHDSHLVRIDCVTCHKEHETTTSFCEQCHAFDMPMPGLGKPTRK